MEVSYLELLNAAKAAKAEQPFPKYYSSAWKWSFGVPETKNFSIAATSARQHPFWHGPAQNQIYEFLTIFEVVPLVRLSQAHKEFIEKKYRTRQLVLGSTFLWSSLYSRCRWFRAWVLRSLPGLERVVFGYGGRYTSVPIEYEEILRATMMCPPRSLHTLLWWHRASWTYLKPRERSPRSRFHATFPSLKIFLWNSSGITAAELACPNLRTAIVGASWEANGLPEQTKFQRVLMDEMQNEATALCRSLDIDFCVIPTRFLSTRTELQKLLDDFEIRAGGGTMNGRAIQLYAAIAPLAKSDWDFLDRLEVGLGKEKSCRSGSLVEWERSSEWSAAQINAIWDKLMALWHLHQVTLSDDVKHVLLHTSIGSEVPNDAPGMLELMETCSLKSICSGVYWLPLLRVEAGEVEGSVPGRLNAIEINQYCAESMFIPELLWNLIGHPIGIRLKRVEKIIDPSKRLCFDFFSDESLHKAVREVLNDDSETIEHLRANERIPLEGVILPNLKTFCATAKKSDTFRSGISTAKGSVTLKLLQEAKHLRRIEMQSECWADIYSQFQKEQEVGLEKVTLTAPSPNDLTHKRFEWPSDSQRIMHHELGHLDGLFRGNDRYDVIPPMQVQFLVVYPAIRRFDELYYCYELVYLLRKKYNHKLQVIACAVGWWDYPWDYAISEMTRGEVTEETWLDLQISTGRSPEDANSTGESRLWNFGWSNQEPKTESGARNRPIVLAGRDPREHRIEEINNLSPLQRDGLERWYSKLRSAIPPDLYTLCSPPFSLGMVSPTDKWFINALKARQFEEINKWIPISWLPTLDFTKIDSCICPSISSKALDRTYY